MNKLAENLDDLVDFCKKRNYEKDEAIALALLCQKDKQIVKLLDLCKDKTDFYDCLEIAVKISQEESK